jgi:hypothetical protein
MMKYLMVILRILYWKYGMKKNKIWKKILIKLSSGYKNGNIQDNKKLYLVKNVENKEFCI